MAAKTLTAANSVYMLSVVGLFITPQRLQGYAADAAFDTDSVESAETALGVDGILSAGWVPVAQTQTITLQADSGSNDMFDQWVQAQKAAKEVFRCNASISLPGTGRKYACVNGVLTGHMIVPGVKKILQPRTFRITWEDISPAPF